MSIMTPLADIFLAGAAEARERAARLGDSKTSGPAAVATPRWSDGWWSGARRLPAHPDRVGGGIHPFSTVVHTTDMLPDEWPALLTAWTGRAGEGACAHFMIGRDEQHGVVQFVPVTRNGNHAGGAGHGVYRAPAGDLHPNQCAVGIEVHCAGGVVRVGDAWRLVEGKVAHGSALPDSDVIPDPHRPGRGWHVVTDYQRRVLGELLDSLEGVLAPVPAGCAKVAFGETPPAYAVLPGCRVATHAELDPVHRADPWPLLCDWLRGRP